MPEELLPKPQIDLPLPEKELPRLSAIEAAGNGGQATKTDSASQGDALEPQNNNLRGSTPKSKWLMLGIAVMILLVILGGVYLLGRNSVFKELNPTNPAIPPKSPVVYEGSQTPGPTADWQTFSPPRTGFFI